jgi:hypothetical protein
MSAVKRDRFISLFLFGVLLAAAVVLAPAPRAAAQGGRLDRDIDLVKDFGFRHVSQRDPLWANLTIGRNEDVDIRMAECGSFLAALSAVIEYEASLFMLPWFRTQFNFLGHHVTLSDFKIKCDAGCESRVASRQAAVSSSCSGVVQATDDRNGETGDRP